MELKINLLKSEKSRSQVLFGIFVFLFAISWIIVIIIEKSRSITTFDWIYSGFFSLTAVSHISRGLGYPIESFFGKAYILINPKLILLKASVFKKEQCINWSEIKSIDCQYNKLKIQKTDNTKIVLALYNLNYISIQRIKKAVNGIAKEKNIEASI